MSCREPQYRLAGYLDGAISSREHALVREHLHSCADCREELERYRLLATRLANLPPAAPPADLAVRIRVQASHARSPWASTRRVWSRILLVFENILRPSAVPATGGILTALVVFVFVVQNILVGVPLGGIVPNDQPLTLVQPARVESLAPFPVSDFVAGEGRPDSGVMLLEATLNSRGEVVTYKILSGPQNVAVQHQLDQLLLFSRFHPLTSFGLPMNGGRVLLSFSEVHVRG